MAPTHEAVRLVANGPRRVAVGALAALQRGLLIFSVPADPSRCLFVALTLSHIALCGCQTPDSATTRSPARSNDATATSATVVGRLEIRQDGARVDMGFLSKVERAGFVAAPRGSDRGIWLGVHGDGTLRWNLAPGDYDLVAVRLQKGSGFSLIPMEGRLALTSNEVVDVGTLLAETGRFGASVRQIEPVSPAASATHGGGNRLLLRSRAVGAFSAVIDICATRWWLQCSSNVKGVTPLDPPVAIELGGLRAARVASLQPSFAWQGPVGASYDFAVWRAVEYQVGTFTKKEYAPGQLVYYAEGLDQAEFAGIPPLEPRSRYYWSVRLRQGDTVSTWSTAGHFIFLIVAMSSSSGRLFEFETP